MNRLRRAVEKKRPTPPSSAGKAMKHEEPEENPPGHEDFKRAVNALWGQAFLALASRGGDDEDAWE